jgi:hypothetical protein
MNAQWQQPMGEFALQHGSKSGENYNSQVALNFRTILFSFNPFLSHHAIL